jgi:hypothetical protein
VNTVGIARPSRRAWLAGTAAALLLFGAAACGAPKSEHERAIDDAAQGARIQARTAADELQRLLRSGDAPRHEEDLRNVDGIVSNGTSSGPSSAGGSSRTEP